MNILSLDLSSKSTGWAVFDTSSGFLIDSGCITSSSLDVIKRIYIMRDGIQEVMQKYNGEIEKIILEEVRPDNRGYGVGNQHTQKVLMWCQAAIAFMVHDNYKDTEIEYIYPSSWRAAIGIQTGRGIKRASLKEADIEFVKANFGVEVNDDEADAICIGYANCHDIETEINWE